MPGQRSLVCFSSVHTLCHLPSSPRQQPFPSIWGGGSSRDSSSCLTRALTAGLTCPGGRGALLICGMGNRALTQGWLGGALSNVKPQAGPTREGAPPNAPRLPWGELAAWQEPSGVTAAANTFPPCLSLDLIVCLFPQCLPLDFWLVLRSGGPWGRLPELFPAGHLLKLEAWPLPSPSIQVTKQHPSCSDFLSKFCTVLAPTLAGRMRGLPPHPTRLTGSPRPVHGGSSLLPGLAATRAQGRPLGVRGSVSAPLPISS